VVVACYGHDGGGGKINSSLVLLKEPVFAASFTVEFPMVLMPQRQPRWLRLAIYPLIPSRGSINGGWRLWT
jgi:hypothetical protein